MPSLSREALQFLQIGGCEGLVATQPLHGEVILVGPEEMPCTQPELAEFIPADQASCIEFRELAELIGEVRVDGTARLALDQSDQVAQPATHLLEHGQRHALPPLIEQQVLNQLHLIRHHRNGVAFLQQAGNLPHLGLKPGRSAALRSTAN